MSNNITRLSALTTLVLHKAGLSAYPNGFTTMTQVQALTS